MTVDPEGSPESEPSGSGAERSAEPGGDTEPQGRGIVYTTEERPPLGRSVVYGFQHIFAMVLGSITGGVVIGDTIGLSDEQIGSLISYINIAVGLATIVQVSVGVRLPVIQGSTSGHLPAYLALGSVGVALYGDPTLTMQYIGGALLVGALLEALFGALRLVRYIFRYVSPMTVGVVIMMVGLGLWPIVADFVGGAWGWAIAAVLLVVLYRFAFGQMVGTMALFLAVVTMYAVASGGTAFGWISDGNAMFVDFGAIRESDWLTAPQPFPWGGLRFEIGFILAMTIPYIATMFESIGDYLAVADASEVDPPNTRRMSRGVLVEGAASATSAIIGGTATSSFSQNVGVVRLSGVASRSVCIVAGIELVVLGLVAKVGTAFASIPRVILGAVYLVAFGILVMTGLRLVLRADVQSQRNETILGSALLLGLALPRYFEDNPIETGMTALDVFGNVFLATPMMVSGLWVFVLDNVVPGTRRERGMEDWIDTG